MDTITRTRNISIPGSKGRPITLDAHYLKDGVGKPVIVFCHGFKGFKDWGHFNVLADFFSVRGFVFVKFNFSYNGTTPGDLLHTNDPEAFGQNNYVIELDDLGLVIDWICSEFPEKQETDMNRLYLLGHSRGGGIAILKACEDNRVKKLVTWAAVSGFIDRNTVDTVTRWKKEGVVYTTNARTKQKLPLYYQFYETLQMHRDRLDILEKTSKLGIPVLIVHARNDEAVPVSDAAELHSSIPGSKLLLLDSGGHTFGGRHPYSENVLPYPCLTVAEETAKFLLSQ